MTTKLFANNRTDEETREIVVSFLDKLNASYDYGAELDLLNRLLFDCITAEADSKGQPIMDTYEEIKASILGF